MNQYKESYDVRKAGVLDFLDRLIEYLGDNEVEAAPIRKLRENVASDFFSIVLVGEFSAGKSSFLNALMGKRILPSFTEETTATVNFLRHTSCAPNGEPGIVYYQDGREPMTLKELTLEEIQNVVSTKGNKDGQTVASTVDHVDLFLKSELLKNGVMLVDSPGLNGIAEHHREITEKQIKASHACIFMFNAERPGAKTDFDTLKELKEGNHNIFFVLNKIDVLRPSEGQTPGSVSAHLKKIYHEQFPEETELPKIWPVSARRALEARDPGAREEKDWGMKEPFWKKQEDDSRIKAFENRLWQYLTQGEKAYAQLTSPVEQGMDTLKKQLVILQAQREVLGEVQADEEVRQQIEILSRQKKELEKDRQKIAPELRKEVTEALNRLKESAGAKSRWLTQKVENKLKQLQTEDDLRTYGEKLARDLEQSYLNLSQKLDQELREEFQDIVQLQHQEYITALGAKFEELAGKVPLPFREEKLDLSSHTVNVDLEQFQNWCNDMQRKIEEQEKEADEAEDWSLRAKRLRRNVEETKKKLRELEDRKRYLQDNFVIPDISYHTEECRGKEWGEGVFGFVGTLLFGRKATVEQKTIADDRARTEALQQQADALAEIEQEISELKAGLDKTGDPSVTPEMVEVRHRRAKEKLEKSLAELALKQEQFTENLKKQSEKICRQLREEIQTYAGDMEQECCGGIENYLSGQSRKYIQAVQDMVNLSLDQELDKTTQKLEELARLAASQGEERQKELDKVTQVENTVQELLAQGKTLMNKLIDEMNDHVEQEAL